MRFAILSVFLLSFFLSVVHGQYAGVFLNTASKARAASFRSLETLPNPTNSTSDKSAFKLEAHHMTIQFKPTPATKFSEWDGKEYRMQVLAYVHDTHAQAVLVALEQPGCQQNNTNGIVIANAWPHVTISHQAQAPYTAVYSNDLIARVVAQDILQVKAVDRFGKPSAVRLNRELKDGFLNNRKTEWLGASGSYTAPATDTTPVQNYSATPIYVKVFPQDGYGIVRLTGTECYNTRWNDTTTSCTLLV